MKKVLKDHMHIVAMTLTVHSKPELVAFMVYRKEFVETEDNEESDGETDTETGARLWIEQIWVLEPLQGQGLDTALLVWAVQLAEKLGCSSAAVPDIVPNLLFFKEVGFEWSATEPRVYQLPIGDIPLPGKLSWKAPLDAIMLGSHIGNTLHKFKKPKTDKVKV